MSPTKKQLSNIEKYSQTTLNLQRAYEELKIAHEVLKKNTIPVDVVNENAAPGLYNENRLRALMEDDAGAIAILTAEGKPVFISSSVRNVLGYSPEEAMHPNVFLLTCDDELDKVKKLWEQVIIHPGVLIKSPAFQMLHKDGTSHWIGGSLVNMLPDADINGIVVNFRDVTEGTKAKNALLQKQYLLEKAEATYRAIFNHANDAILLVDDEGKYVQVNPSAEKMLGYTSNEMLQLHTGDVIDKIVLKNEVAEGWDEFIKDGSQNGIVEMKGKNGNIIICQYNATANILPGLHLSILTDITERESSRREIESQRKKINTILDSITDGFYSVDKKWTVTYWNREAEHLFRNKREEMIGKNLWSVHPGTIPLKFYSEYHKAMEQNVSVNFEEFFPPLSKWFEVSAYPSEEGLSIYFKEITERKKTDDAIHASNERYIMVAKATHDSIWDWDLKTNAVIRPGNLLETLFGYEGRHAEEVDDFWNRHAHPEDWSRINQKRNEMFDDPTKNYWEDEYRFLKSNGQYAYVYDRAYIIRDNDGKVIRMIGASRDITKEKEQVNEILRIQQNLDSLINTTTDPIWSINTGFKIIAANKAYNDFVQAINGEPVKEGDEVALLIPGEITANNWSDLYSRALAGETFNTEKSFYNPATKHIWHTIVSFSAIIDKDGSISGVACYQKDVTELKKAGKKLEELNNSLEKRAEELATSNSELERFAYMASHDLQEPLRMISSFLQLLQKKYKDNIDETAARYIHFSVDGAERMKNLINDMLQYSRVGTVSLEITAVNMNEVVKDVVQTFQNEIQSLSAKIIIGEMPVIEAGRSAMTQLVQNLVGNALKYHGNEPPIITIKAKGDFNEWVFSVEDNGIGLDPKFNDRIFILFQRLHTKDEYSGTGMGLAICKKIIERYHGRIWVESVMGKGSKFIFTIPKKYSTN